MSKQSILKLKTFKENIRGKDYIGYPKKLPIH